MNSLDNIARMCGVEDNGHHQASTTTSLADAPNLSVPVGNLSDNCEEQQRQRARQELGGLDMTNANLALLLRLGSMRNSQHETQLQVNPPTTEVDNYNTMNTNDSLTSYSTNTVQQYLHRQQRLQQQHILEQNLLTQRLYQLQRAQTTSIHDSSLGIHQPFGMTNGFDFAPALASAVQMHNFTPSAQTYQHENCNHQDRLLEVLLGNAHTNILLLQQSNNVNPLLFNAVGGSSSLYFRILRHVQQSRLSSELDVNTPSVAMGQLAESIAVSANAQSTNEKPSVTDKESIQEQTPIRALSAYNFFFRYERERILNSKVDEDDNRIDFSQKSQEALLQAHWNRDRSIKRRHRKSHGKISFAELSRKISQRWNELPVDQKNYFSEVATKDWQRYHREMAQQKRGGNVSNPKKG